MRSRSVTAQPQRARKVSCIRSITTDGVTPGLGRKLRTESSFLSEDLRDTRDADTAAPVVRASRRNEGNANQAASLLLLSTRLASLRTAIPSISRDIPVISRLTPNNVPIAHTELDGQCIQISPPSSSV